MASATRSLSPCLGRLTAASVSRRGLARSLSYTTTTSSPAPSSSSSRSHLQPPHPHPIRHLSTSTLPPSTPTGPSHVAEALIRTPGAAVPPPSRANQLAARESQLLLSYSSLHSQSPASDASDAISRFPLATKRSRTDSARVYHPSASDIREGLRPLLDFSSEGGRSYSVDDLEDALLQRLVTDKSVATWKGLGGGGLDARDERKGTKGYQRDVEDLVENAGEHNAKLAFFGRRVLQFAVSSTLLSRLPPQSLQRILTDDLVELLSSRRLIGQWARHEWGVHHYSRWIRLREPSGNLGDGNKEAGNVVLAVLGGVWWRFGQAAAISFFSTRILPIMYDHFTLMPELPKSYLDYVRSLKDGGDWELVVRPRLERWALEKNGEVRREGALTSAESMQEEEEEKPKRRVSAGGY